MSGNGYSRGSNSKTESRLEQLEKAVEQLQIGYSMIMSEMKKLNKMPNNNKRPNNKRPKTKTTNALLDRASESYFSGNARGANYLKVHGLTIIPGHQDAFINIYNNGEFLGTR